MDMLAMAYLFDLASKNRRWDEHFEPRPPSRATLLARRLLAFAGKKRSAEQPSAETCDDRDDPVDAAVK